MKTGTIKFFLDKKGYGFITPDDNSKDIFFHIQDVQSEKEEIKPGATVEYEIGAGKDRREKAINVSLI